MRVSVLRTAVALAVLAGWNPPLVSSPAAGKTTNPTKQWRSGSAGPFGDRLVFERNAGQAPPEVTHIARGPGYRLLLGRRSAVFLLGRSSGPPSVVRLELAGARDPSAVEGVGRLPSRSHYLLNGRTTALAAPHFSGVRYRRVYPGIDLVFYGRRRDVEFDFVVAPGADPGRIGWRYYGARRVALDGGALLVETPAGSLRQHAPVAFQEVDGERRRVECRYVLEDGLVRLALGPYRRDLPLIIDPVVTYATYVGGAGADYVTAMAVDSAGYLYLTGYTRSASLPGLNGYQQFNAGLDDVFVAKLSPDGTSLVWVSFLGGAAWDYGRAIAVDAAGNVYLAGESWSAGFPLTADSYRPYCCGIFVAKLDPAGASLVYSTFVGSGYVGALVIDTAGRAYVGGWTDSAFPVTPGAYQQTLQGMEDGFLARLAADGSAVEYATYIGGGGNDRILSVALGPSGSVHAAGFTESANFPVTPDAAQTAFGGLRDAFVVKLASALDTLNYSSFFGGSAADAATSVAVDAYGKIYAAGFTESNDFPTVAGSYLTFPSGAPPWGFITAVDPATGQPAYATYFGREIQNAGLYVAVDGYETAFIGGSTSASVFPVTPDAFVSSPAGGRDGFVARLSAGGDTVLFSSRIGGCHDDYVYALRTGPNGAVYLAGITQSPDFPVTPGAAQSTPAGAGDVFAMRLDAFGGPAAAVQFSAAEALAAGADALADAPAATACSSAPDTTDISGFVNITGGLCVGGTSCSGNDGGIEVRSAAPRLSLVDGFGNSWQLEANAGAPEFAIREAAAGEPSRSILRVASGAPENSLVISAPGGYLGLGTASPSAAIHIVRSDGAALVRVEDNSPTPALRTMFEMKNNGPVNTTHITARATWRQQFQDNAYVLTKNGTGGNELTLIAGSGDMYIRGRLYTGAPTCSSGCDSVLDPDFTVESIEEHARRMWSRGHLPAVGPTSLDQPFDVTEKVGGILNELEKAHIYIEQLHRRLRENDEQIRRLTETLGRLEARLAER